MLYPAGHRYQRAGIGSHESLDRITLADARAFVREHYRPEKTTIMVIGNFDQKEVRRLLSRSFPPQVVTRSGKPEKNFKLGNPIARTSPKLEPPSPTATALRRIKGPVTNDTLFLAWSLPPGFNEDYWELNSTTVLTNIAMWRTFAPRIPCPGISWSWPCASCFLASWPPRRSALWSWFRDRSRRRSSKRRSMAYTGNGAAAGSRWICRRRLGTLLREDLWQAIRQKNGASYGANAWSTHYPGGTSLLQISGYIQNNKAVPALSTILERLAEVGRGRINRALLLKAMWTVARRTHIQNLNLEEKLKTLGRAVEIIADSK